MYGVCADFPYTHRWSDFIMDILKAVLRCHQGFEFNDTHTQAARKSVTCSDLIQKPSTESLVCGSSGISHTDLPGQGLSGR